MSGLRFCMLTTFYPPHSFGGDGIGVQRLCRALVRAGHDVTVVHDVDAYNALHHGPGATGTAAPDGIKVIGLRSRVGMLSPLLTQQLGRPVVHGRRLRALLAEGNFDVVQFNNISLVGGPGLLGLPRNAVTLYEAHEHWLVCPTHVLWRHRREVCTSRECIRCTLRHKRPPQLWRYTGMLPRNLDRVDAFIAKSEFSRDKHREFGFPRDMEVIPYFLEGTDHDQTPSTSPHDRPYFLFVGRLERIKGLDDVIPLFRKYPDADLLVAGDGDHADHLKALAAGIPQVKFLGRVPPEELRRYYTHCVASIVPSVCFETFGIIIIEAFRQGTPVIARRIGPFPEIVERCEGGEMFSTVDELASAMHRLQHDGEHRSRLASNAQRGFESWWSEAAVLPQYLELVRRIAVDQTKHHLVKRLDDVGAV